MHANLRIAALAIATLAAIAPASPSLAEGPVPTDAEPPVPGAVRPSHGPGAVRVAIVDSGVDYTLPLVRDALLRHAGGPADGTIVGIDFRDLDHRPFDAVRAGPRTVRHGTAVASVLLREAPGVALVPYRYPGQDMRLMGALVAHAAAHGVRAIGLPLGSDRKGQWAAFERAARAHPEILFVASAGNDGRDLDVRPLYPASLGLGNLLVVTSADDFGRPSPESGTGRGTVDYLVFAEAVPVTGFGGREAVAAGSSHAVPRLLALAARILARDPALDAAGVAAEIRRAHGNGLRPRDVAEGLAIDPLADTVGALAPAGAGGTDGVGDTDAAVRAAVRAAPVAASDPLEVPLDVLVLDGRWDGSRVAGAVGEAARILGACGLALVPDRVERPALDGPAERLRDLAPGAAATLFDRLGRGRGRAGARPVAAVFARDTRMAVPFDAEAFGRANTRSRPWLADSVWSTLALEDDGIALAHELWHVLANSGEHVEAAGDRKSTRLNSSHWW